MTVSIRLAAFFVTISCLSAQSPHWDEIRKKTGQRLERISDSAGGVVGYSIVDLTDGDRFDRNADWVFPQGSSIKIPILMEIYKQAAANRIQLDQRVPIAASDKVGGSGILKELGDGTSHLSVRDLGVLMILVSDNTATNMLIELAGMENINRHMDSLGLKRTRVRRLMMDTAARGRGDENTATPREAARIMEMLFRGKFLTPAASKDILSILGKFKRGQIRSGLPEPLTVSFKPGGIPGVSTEWAIVHLGARPYVAVIMGNYGLEGDFSRVMQDISRTAYDYFWRKGRSSRYGTYVDPALIPK